MPSLNDKREGVYLIVMDGFKKLVYIGRSSGVGSAKRSSKSKLKSGKFFNKMVQEDYNKYGGKFQFPDVVLLDNNQDMDTLFTNVRAEWLDKGFNLYNDILVVEKEGVKSSTKSGEDKYDIDGLEESRREMVLDVLDFCQEYDDKYIDLLDRFVDAFYDTARGEAVEFDGMLKMLESRGL